MYQLLALPYLSLSADILSRFTVRIHSRIVEKGRPWVRLWYFCRAFDQDGSGYLRLPILTISQLLEAAPSSIYQWLREGKAAGAFRWWKCQRGKLRVALGGLFAVCRDLISDSDSGKQRHAPWGTPSEVGLHEILTLQKLRAAATVATTQRLQQLSRFAAWRKLPGPARKIYKLPQPDAFFPSEEAQRLSDNHAKGSIRCVIHIGKRRVWTSRGFIPFGVSQQTIANERGIADRTVRRHLALMNVDRRQVVQSKSEYKLAADCLHHDGGAVEPSEDVNLRSSVDGSYYLSEKGLGGYNTIKVGEVGFHRISSRFFTYGAKPKVWLYRCNIYQPRAKLCTMSSRRSEYRRLSGAHSAPTAMLPPLCQPLNVSLGDLLAEAGGHTTTFSRRGGVTSCNRPLNSFENSDRIDAIPAEKEGHFS
ncbi:hypothetical protein [Allocoleopsis franciscana]|uniref:Uncharacterized protein n=1 Tax=Allocoleopsis franciscana PCC 7113 TaxID=1173027 RepID=K9WPR2_9CYAN|nr:hypothetical protein [Allocoleopsis franciscana]AFZ22380.1 hypothetical protein Mic7113_6823 [Allocoleopsis franciscana PCC 7113]